MSQYTVEQGNDLQAAVCEGGAVVYDDLTPLEAAVIAEILNEGLGPEWDKIEQEFHRRMEGRVDLATLYKKVCRLERWSNRHGCMHPTAGKQGQADNELATAKLLLAEAANLIEEAITTHIYDLCNGEEIPPDCPYTKAAHEIRRFLGTECALCDECGEPFRIDGTGIANHLTADGGIDHDADADHVPYTTENQE